MMQVYAEGSDKAVELYQKAFDAALVAAFPAEDGTYYHSELDVYGQILSVAESRHSMEYPDENGKYPVSFAPGVGRNPGNTMQFCLHFGEGNADKVRKGYDVLKEGGLILYPLGPVEYSPCACDVVDRFGVRWCLFE
jgi:PhnB protein